MDIQLKRSAAAALLDIHAVNFTVNEPVEFKSRIKSPIYIDNRTLISHPGPWRVIIEGFAAFIAASQIDFDVLAGVAVGGVTHCSALAYTLQKPSVFIRKEAKQHGLRKIIEGGDVSDLRVLLVEDHVTTGGSSMYAIERLRDAGAEISDVVSIISYGFTEAREQFENKGLQLHTLTDFDTLLSMALDHSLISGEELVAISNWLAVHRT